jgi:hypothetical protein
MNQRYDKNNGSGGGSYTSTGVGMVSIMANMAYAGMRAQNSRNSLGRVLTFIVGFPGTLLTYFFV